MFDINHRKKFNLIRLKDVYYAPRIQQDHSGYDAVYYFHCQNPVGHSKEKKTMLIDLAREPEEILASFRKKTRVAIKKALENKEVYFEINEHPKTRDVEMFIKAYNAFAVQKNILACDENFLRMLLESDILIIASAIKGNELLCQFALINAQEKMVCYHGYNTRFSNLEDPDKVKLISQANRALEYYCMLDAKNRGKIYYDLCGLTEDPNNPGAEKVDQYKMGFRGQVATEYHFMRPVTFKGKVFCWVKQLSGGI